MWHSASDKRKYIMDFSHLLKSGIPDSGKLRAYGFSENDGGFILNRELSDKGFYISIKITEQKISADVFEKATGESYILFNVESAQGGFINGMRNEAAEIMQEIFSECFNAGDIRKEYFEFIGKTFNTFGDNPFSDDTLDSTAFRTPEGKWFALVMKIKYKNLGLKSDDPVWAVNLKCSTDKISQVVDGKTIFNAWHMNKKHWITVLLTVRTDFELLCSLTMESYGLVHKK